MFHSDVYGRGYSPRQARAAISQGRVAAPRATTRHARLSSAANTCVVCGETTLIGRMVSYFESGVWRSDWHCTTDACEVEQRQEEQQS